MAEKTWLEEIIARSQGRELVSETEDIAVIRTVWFKNRGKEDEVSGTVDVEVPNSLEAAIEMLGEEGLLNIIANQLITRATNQVRAQVVDPEKAQRRAEDTAKKLKDLADQLGVPLEDLLNM